jgi:hypothetical protein
MNYRYKIEYDFDEVIIEFLNDDPINAWNLNFLKKNLPNLSIKKDKNSSISRCLEWLKENPELLI